MTYTPTQWAVTKIAHPALRDVREACTDCLALAEPAIDMARVTGSVGCTYGGHTKAEDGTYVEHSATVARAVEVLVR